jgi:hypothetical protein
MTPAFDPPPTCPAPPSGDTPIDAVVASGADIVAMSLLPWLVAPIRLAVLAFVVAGDENGEDIGRVAVRIFVAVGDARRVREGDGDLLGVGDRDRRIEAEAEADADGAAMQL